MDTILYGSCDNWVIRGVCRRKGSKGKHIITSYEFIQSAGMRQLCSVSATAANRILAGLAAEDRLVKCRKNGHWAYGRRKTDP